MTNSNTQIEQKIQGTLYSKVIEELITNSLHFPMVNLILEALKEGSLNYFKEPDAYVLILCALTQAIGLTILKEKKSQWRFFGHLIGPCIYILLEAPLEGLSFFAAPHHIGYWVFSLLIGSFEFWSTLTKAKINEACVLIENIIRTLIPLTMYALFEADGKSFFTTLPFFFTDTAHIFLSIVIFLLGILIGFEKIQNNRSKRRVSELARQLKNYSSWSLGEIVLNKAMNDESVFKIKRVQRTIFFIDIRKFTKWSEKETPENVVNMLNVYYSTAENVLKKFSILKMKFTADEIMIVFDDHFQALAASLILRDSLNEILRSYQLSAGGGLHTGPVVEGLMGSSSHKIFDIMGDTVNTAKRYCESAQQNEILISQNIIDLSNEQITTSQVQEIIMKGKEEKQKAYTLITYTPA